MLRSSNFPQKKVLPLYTQNEEIQTWFKSINCLIDLLYQSSTLLQSKIVKVDFIEPHQRVELPKTQPSHPQSYFWDNNNNIL